MYLVNNRRVNCFRTHNELTMGLLGKYPLTPSVCEFCKITFSIVGGLVLGTYWVWAIKKAVVGHKQLNTVDDGCWRNIARDAKCQECYKNSAHFTQFLLSFLTYVLLSYFVRPHCANLHTPLPFLSYLYDFQTMKARHQIHWAKEYL